MSSHISDDPSQFGPQAAARPPAARQPEPDAPAPVDPDLLPDYAEFQAWKKRQAEIAADAETANGEALDVARLKLRIRDGETVHEFSTVDVTDRDVLAHLQMLVTFAENESDRAAAVFEAVLGPTEYVRLQRTIRPMMRRIRLAHEADPENNPSVTETWAGMIETIAGPIQELASDPKRLDSLRGRSRTGHSSSTDSLPSGLPSTG